VFDTDLHSARGGFDALRLISVPLFCFLTACALHVPLSPYCQIPDGTTGIHLVPVVFSRQVVRFEQFQRIEETGFRLRVRTCARHCHQGHYDPENYR